MVAKTIIFLIHPVALRSSFHDYIFATVNTLNKDENITPSHTAIVRRIGRLLLTSCRNIGAQSETLKINIRCAVLLLIHASSYFAYQKRPMKPMIRSLMISMTSVYSSVIGVEVSNGNVNIGNILKQDLPVTQLDGIVSLMVDAICTTGKTVKISGESKSREEVCRRFLALNDIHIRYVFDRMKEENNIVQHPRGYLLARLYEAEEVMDTYYQIRVNHDMNTVNN